MLGRFEVPVGAAGPVYRVSDTADGADLKALRPAFKDDAADAAVAGVGVEAGALVQLCKVRCGRFRSRGATHEADRPPACTHSVLANSAALRAAFPLYNSRRAHRCALLALLAPLTLHIAAQLLQQPLQQPQDFEAGSFRRVLRSAPAAQRPKPFVGGSAQELVGTEFDEMVLADRDTDSLVFLYMPKCAHCQRMGEQFKAMVAKVQAGRPALKFFTLNGPKVRAVASASAGRLGVCQRCQHWVCRSTGCVEALGV